MTGKDKTAKTQGVVQNLKIDFSTNTNGRILSAYNET